MISGTNLTQRFHDQFRPMLIGQNMPWSSSDSTIIRMPLSSECLKDGLELGLKRVKKIFERFMKDASRTLIFLKSVLQVLFLVFASYDFFCMQLLVTKFTLEFFSLLIVPEKER